MPQGNCPFTKNPSHPPPVVAPGQREKRIYMPELPDGRCWLDFQTRQCFAAGAWHNVAAPLGHLPMFVAQGAKIAVASPLPGQLPRHDDPVSEILDFGPLLEKGF